MLLQIPIVRTLVASLEDRPRPDDLHRAYRRSTDSTGVGRAKSLDLFDRSKKLQTGLKGPNSWRRLTGVWARRSVGMVGLWACTTADSEVEAVGHVLCLSPIFLPTIFCQPAAFAYSVYGRIQDADRRRLTVPFQSKGCQTCPA